MTEAYQISMTCISLYLAQKTVVRSYQEFLHQPQVTLDINDSKIACMRITPNAYRASYCTTRFVRFLYKIL